jgi:hypothetical protein
MDKEKRVNIHLKENNHTLAKLISTVKGITLNEYLEDAIERAIEKDKEIIKKLTDK